MSVLDCGYPGRPTLLFAGTNLGPDNGLDYVMNMTYYCCDRHGVKMSAGPGNRALKLSLIVWMPKQALWYLSHSTPGRNLSSLPHSALKPQCNSLELDINSKYVSGLGNSTCGRSNHCVIQNDIQIRHTIKQAGGIHVGVSYLASRIRHECPMLTDAKWKVPQSQHTRTRTSKIFIVRL